MLDRRQFRCICSAYIRIYHVAYVSWSEVPRMKRPRLRASVLGCIATLTLAFISISPLFQSTSLALAAGAISGTVYRDYNANGARDAVEPQFAGIIVTAFDSSGVVRGTTTTVRCSGAGAGVDT